MAGLVQHKQFTVLATDVVGTTIDVTFGFVPAAVILVWNDRGAAGIGRATLNYGFGFAVSPTSRRAQCGKCRDDSPSSDGRSIITSFKCGLRIDPVGGAVIGTIDYDAILGDGSRFIVDQQFASDTTFDVIGLGGDHLAEIDDMILPDTGGGTHTHTGLARRPGLVIFMGIGQPGIPASNAQVTGVIAGMINGSDQFSSGIGSDGSGIGTSETARHTRHGDIAGSRLRGSGAITGRFSFNSITSDGFIVNVIEDSDDRYPFLALAGGEYAIRDFLTKTDGTDIVVPIGFEATGGLVVSACTTEASSSDDDSTPKKLVGSLGVFSSPTERGCRWGFDGNGFATMGAASGLRSNAVYLRATEVASPVEDGLMDLKQIDPTDLVFVMDNPDPSPAHCVVVAFGSVPVVSNARRRKAIIAAAFGGGGAPSR